MDELLHAMISGGQARVAAVSGGGLVAEAQKLHGLSRVATAALGRQLMMTAMMASQLKNAGDRVSTILRGDGPAGSLICTGAPGPLVKGYATNPSVELPPTAAGKLDVGGYVGHTGKLTVVRDLPVGDPYVGVCSLVSGEIAEDFAQYFTVSEQQPSLVYLGVRMDAQSGRVRAAGGMLVQSMPGCPDALIDALQARAAGIAALSHLLDEGRPLQAAVEETLAGLDLAVVERFAPALRCDCSRERVERALIAVGAGELRDMIDRDGGAEIKCHFCNTEYRFTAAQLEQLLSQAGEDAHGKEAAEKG